MNEDSGDMHSSSALLSDNEWSAVTITRVLLCFVVDKRIIIPLDDFVKLCSSSNFSPRISCITGPKFIKFVNDVEGSLAL